MLIQVLITLSKQIEIELIVYGFLNIGIEIISETLKFVFSFGLLQRFLKIKFLSGTVKNKTRAQLL